MHALVCVRMCVAHLCACVYTCVCVCMCACVYVRVRVCTRGVWLCGCEVVWLWGCEVVGFSGFGVDTYTHTHVKYLCGIPDAAQRDTTKKAPQQKPKVTHRLVRKDTHKRGLLTVPRTYEGLDKHVKRDPQTWFNGPTNMFTCAHSFWFPAISFSWLALTRWFLSNDISVCS